MEMWLKSKSNYLHQMSCEQLYIIAEHWKSDLDFFTDEINFLKRLINKYFIWLTQEENARNLHKVHEKLMVSERFKNDLLKVIALHREHLGNMMENPFSCDEQMIKEQHIRIEEDMTDFVKSFKNIKKELYQTTGDVIDSEGLHQ